MVKTAERIKRERAATLQITALQITEEHIYICIYIYI